ncbi:MAG: hypothetical protein MZV70_35915 [Desulfobacterales bacterium]|nr:hypothetical protein [Desulfobacterales bacterium]
MVKDYKSVYILGCNTCVAICHAGGGKEAEIIEGSMLKMKAAQEGKDMTINTNGIMRQCRARVLRSCHGRAEEAEPRRLDGLAVWASISWPTGSGTYLSTPALKHVVPARRAGARQVHRALPGMRQRHRST